MRLSNLLAPELKEALLHDPAQAAELAEELHAADLAELIDGLPDDAAVVKNTAGGRMTTDFVALAPMLTVERAIDEVRRMAESKETIYEVYAVDPNGTLLGAVSLRNLVLARAGQPLSAVMNAEVVSVPPEMDQEDVARLFEHYDLLAVPVVDEKRKLLGIVTVDDVVSVLKQEQAEDIQKLGAVQPTEEGYFQTDFWTFVRKRAGWLIAIFMGEIVTASVLEHYEGIRRAFIAVEVFVPLIISSGGNTGSQASSLVIRGLALGEFGPGAAIRILWREVRMGLVLGGFLGTIGLIRALLGGHGGLALAVGIALIAVVTFGSVIGAVLPLLIKRLGFDPAVSSGPFIASLVDIIGIGIYLKIATMVLL
jgi:magnesium transporter